MKIIEIIAGAQAGFNHPHESYANFRPSLTLKALVEDGDDDAEAIARLQKRAQDACDAEKARILAACQREHDIAHSESELRRWRDVVASYRHTLSQPAPDEDEQGSTYAWEIDQKIRAFHDAQECIGEAEKRLADATAQLGALKPETLPIIVLMDGVEQCRCTLGEFVQSNPDTLPENDLAGIARSLPKSDGYTVPLGAGGICVLKFDATAAA